MVLLASTLALAACHRTGRVDPASDGGATSTSTSSTVVELPRCKAEGLGTATLVKPWQPPTACHWRGLAHGATTIIHSEADLIAGALDCPASGVDFAKSSLVVTGRALSPATVGIDVYDDGKKVTFVSRQRDSCPNEVPPMPITVPLAFLVPAGETRTFAEATCKQVYTCP
ncbi:MAG: hypothetical protein JWO86_1196 [Myxococcaceae bacterium]|nr:hypothetical protein [Myxococcaceae bacterium]